MDVSVVMATFNEPAEIIAKAINSILNQTLSDLELLIIDDSTNRETRAAIDATASDSRVKIVRRDTRIGFVPALNIGLEMARGRYIARMDGDDIAMPEKLEIQVNYLDEKPDISVVGSAINIIDQNDNITSNRPYPTMHSTIVRYAIFRSPFAHPTVLMRREIVDQGLRYDDTLTRCEDLDLWLRLLKKGYKFANIDRPLLNYRVIGDLATKRKNDHWITNRMVRLRNFSFKMLPFSFLSACTAIGVSIVPRKLISQAYKKENSKVIDII